MKIITTYVIRAKSYDKCSLLFECENDKWFLQHHIYRFTHEVKMEEIEKSVAIELLTQTNK